MKKVKKAKPFSKKYYPVVLYLDALQELDETFRENCKSVEISSADYKFDSLDDAKQHFGDRPQFEFSFSSSDPYAQVEFSRMEAKLYVSSGVKAAHLFHELDAIIQKQQRSAKALYKQWIWGSLMFLSIPASLLIDKVPKHIQLTWLVFLTAVFVWYMWVVYVGLRLQSVLIFARRSEAKTFFETNRNAIIMTILTSLISGAIGYGFAKLRDGAPSAAPAVPSSIATEKPQ
jgi:hypothetical protein